MNEAIIQLVLYALLGIPIAAAGGWLAPKFGGSQWLWIVLGLIPGVNLLVFYMLPIRACGAILDRMTMLDRKVETQPQQGTAIGAT